MDDLAAELDRAIHDCAEAAERAATHAEGLQLLDVASALSDVSALCRVVLLTRWPRPADRQHTTRGAEREEPAGEPSG